MTTISLNKPDSSTASKPTQATDSVLLASSLHRTLGDHAAVSDISLNLNRGDVLGLLGLNGAGKSTTLRMLCGMLVPDSGQVTVNGYCMAEAPLLARAHIGFLPDQPPLYDDMRVHEYLQLCAQIRALKGKTLVQRKAAVIEQCALGDVQNKLIDSLSKGYRQRVGLAQAIIHQPSVLLLDEPGNGLDPQQLDAMRELIRRYAEEHAVVFSTHLLAEAQSTCNRIAIIHEGRLVADEPADGADIDTLFRGAVA